MTVRRALEPVRIGRWLPPGERVWRVLYDARKTRRVAAALSRKRRRPPRPISALPHGCPPGWGTIDDIWQQYAGEKLSSWGARSLRKDLHDGVPSERVVVRRIRVVFPIKWALSVLRRRWPRKERARC